MLLLRLLVRALAQVSLRVSFRLVIRARIAMGLVSWLHVQPNVRLGSTRRLSLPCLHLLCPTASSPLAFGGGMGLASLGALPPRRLSLGSQPATHQLQARWGLAISLVPASGLVDAAAPLAQTDAAAKSPPAGGTTQAQSMLETSQGRSLLPEGPPERLRLSPSGILIDLRLDSPLARDDGTSPNLVPAPPAAHAGS
jgi:hypothetical protein